MLSGRMLSRRPDQVRSATAPKKRAPPSGGLGFVVVLGSGLGFLGGKAAEGLEVSTGLVTSGKETLQGALDASLAKKPNETRPPAP